MSNIGNKETMAKNIVFYLDKTGESQVEMAEIVGVAKSTFNDWVKARKYPRIDKIEIMANHWRIKMSDLIEEQIDNDDIKEANAVARISRFAQMNDKYLEVALLLTELSEAELDSVGNLVLMLTQKSENKK